MWSPKSCDRTGTGGGASQFWSEGSNRENARDGHRQRDLTAPVQRQKRAELGMLACRILKTDTPINPGDNGSAVTSDRGELVGVVSHGSLVERQESGNIGVDEVRAFLSRHLACSACTSSTCPSPSPTSGGWTRSSWPTSAGPTGLRWLTSCVMLAWPNSRPWTATPSQFQSGYLAADQQRVVAR